MKILGIDPALSCLGWGVIYSSPPSITYVGSGIIKTKPSTLMHLRLSDITCCLEQIIDLYQPQAIAMEETFINMNPSSSLKLGYVRGAIMAMVGKTKLPFYEYKPNKIKKTIVGVGHAEKEQVKHMVKLVISGSTDDICFDQADALAIAYTCLVDQKHL